MKCRRVFVLVAIATFVLCIHAQTLPDRVKEAHTVFVDNQATGDAVVKSATLALSSSKLRVSQNRSTADLVFTFKRDASQADRKVDGNQITITLRNTCTLAVTDSTGQTMWEGSADLDPNRVRKGRDEKSLREWLAGHPAATLVRRFLTASDKQ